MQGSSNQQSQPSGQQQQIAPPAQTNTPPQSQQGQQPRQQSTIDVPVRILVPSDSVGAIIGKGGQTIRQLTQQTRAKVDVYRGDPMAPTTVLQEKVITIRGQPENCINACREILKVMRADAESKGKPADFPLKVLAHNDYIGRIIGKQGNIINAIKKDTDTSVTVSSINDVSLNVERVITVKGDLENMIKALEIIHSKVKAAFENDTKTYGAQAILMGGIPPLSLTAPAFATAQSAAAAAAAAAALNSAPPTSAARFAAAAAAAAAVAAAAQQHVVPGTGAAAPLTGSSQAGAATPGQQNGSNGTPGAQVGANGSQTAVASSAAASGAPQAAAAYGSYYAPTIYHQVAGVHPGAGMSVGGAPGVDLMGVGATAEPETVYLYIPNVAVGAIIGTKGSYIKNIIKLSGASVKITPMSPEESKQAVERQVVITGSPDSQWRAQYYIYEKIKQERFTSDDNVKLRAELRVPSSIVGRIIGKSGKNVRELQRATGATIKLPEDIQGGNQGPHSASNEQQPSTENTNEQTESKTEVKSEETVETSETTPAPVVEATPVEQTPAENGINHAGDEEQENKSVAENDEAEGENGAAANTSLNGKSQSGQSDNNKDFVTVRIFGTFHASQAAQRRILSLVTQSLVPQSSAAAAAAVAAVALQQQRSYNAGAAVASSPYSMHAMAPPMPILNYHGDRYMNAPPAHHHHQQAHHHHHGQQPQQHQYHHQGKTNGYGPRRNTSRPYGNNGKQQLDQQNHNTSLNGSAPTNDQQQQQQAPSHSPNVAQQPIAAN